MAKTTKDDDVPEIELVTVTHPDLGTDEVPLDAAMALEAQKTGWVRDDKSRIAQLTAERDALQAQIDELTTATKASRKQAADSKSEED